jgi:histidine phosphotransferase ChpT
MTQPVRLPDQAGLPVPPGVSPRISELLASRICHDLVSPVGAINNGLELIEEMGDEVRAEAMDLIAVSAKLAAHRLAYFRLAYGAGASRSPISLADARQVAIDLFQHSRIELDWPRYLIVPFEAAGANPAKIILCTLLLAEEAVQRGTVELASQEGRDRLTFRLMGREPGLNEASRAAFEGKLDEAALDPRTVHAFLTGQVVRNLGYYLTFDPVGAERLDLHLGLV